MSMKNSNDKIANRTRELPACDPFTIPPYFRFYTAFFGEGKRAKPGNLLKYLLEIGGKWSKKKKRNFTFLYKRESVFFFNFGYFELLIVVKIQKS